jgi:hypothetical protein
MIEVCVRSVAASLYILRQVGHGRGSWKASFREPESPDFSALFPSDISMSLLVQFYKVKIADISGSRIMAEVIVTNN